METAAIVMRPGDEEQLAEVNDGDEFAVGASEWGAGGDGVSRRALLRLAGASLAVAGIAGAAGCKDRPDGETIVPYVDPPVGTMPGVPVVYATALSRSGYARGALVTSREGRPIKIEGNPDHPSSLGGTDVFAQAAILDLYSPARLKAPTEAGEPADWSAFFGKLDEAVGRARASSGGDLRVLVGCVTSPTLAGQLAELERTVAGARWHTYETVSRSNAHAGAEMAFGRALDAVYDFRQAEIVVSLDCDFLFAEPGSLRYARDFADGRRVRFDATRMNRLYAAEGAWSSTGSMADHRLRVRPGDVEALARALAAACGVAGVEASVWQGARSGYGDAWVRAAAADLASHRGAGVVVAGEWQPPEVHALALAINHALGNLGKTVALIAPVDAGADSSDPRRGLGALAADMRAGKVGTLLIFGGDPARQAPDDTGFRDALEEFTKGGGLSAHLCAGASRTSFLCRWQLPESHELEAWGDLRGHDGTAALVQPLIAPLNRSLSAVEVMERVLGRPDRSGYEAVRAQWKSRAGAGDFEAWWQAQLRRGTVERTAATAVAVGAPRLPPPRRVSSSSEIEVSIRPDYSAWDGRFFGNVWLQELPRPFTKLVWDNAVLVSAATAARLEVAANDVVRITAPGGRSVEGAVLVVPGMADGVAAVTLGYGTEPPAGVEGPVGFDVYPLRTSGEPWTIREGVSVEKTGAKYALVVTNSHHAMNGATEGGRPPQAIATSHTSEQERETGNRGLVRVATLAEYRANPQIVRDLGGAKERKPLLTMYEERKYTDPYQWGMSIDQTACIGCGACVVACQAENNIAVVGKAEVARQREMHWIRIDDYFEAPTDASAGGATLEDAGGGAVHHQPVPCMHCENAPCEYVCPVGATTHSTEGLNQMTYNRCVGTRYCSNNCPYKVRRFNFLDYTRFTSRPSDVPRNNPEVTVRTRGVMEKCTYCVQRIERTRGVVSREVLSMRERARTAADPTTRAQVEAIADRREFELVSRLETACAQACPTRAIEFGSIAPVAGRATSVMAAKASPLDYSLLRELGTVPRTTYLGRVRNPGPAWTSATAATKASGGD
jgi:molybdopterin-containing oxidoreductase family iron-sulfur binding subunit